MRTLLLALVATTAAVSCTGQDSTDPVDPLALAAALDEIGLDITDGRPDPAAAERCPVLPMDDVVDLMSEAGVIDTDPTDVASSFVQGAPGEYTIACTAGPVSIGFSNTGADDVSELEALMRAQLAREDDVDVDVDAIEIDGIDADQTYVLEVDFGDVETRRVGWIAEEVRVEVSVNDPDRTPDADDLAAVLVGVLELLDEEYGDTEPIERPEPPLDLSSIGEGLDDIADDTDNLLVGEVLDDCPLLSDSEVDDLDAALGGDGVDDADAFVSGSTTTVSVVCSFTVEDRRFSVSAGSVDADNLEDYRRALETFDSGDRDLEILVDADDLPSEAVFVERREESITVGVLSGEVVVTLNVRGADDSDPLLAELAALVSTIEDRI